MLVLVVAITTNLTTTENKPDMTSTNSSYIVKNDKTLTCETNDNMFDTQRNNIISSNRSTTSSCTTINIITCVTGTRRMTMIIRFFTLVLANILANEIPRVVNTFIELRIMQAVVNQQYDIQN